MLLRRSGRVRGVTFRAHGKCTDAAAADFRVTGKVKAKKLLYSIPNSIDAPCSEFPREEEFGERIVGQFIPSSGRESEGDRADRQAGLVSRELDARAPRPISGLFCGWDFTCGDAPATRVHPLSRTQTFFSSFSTMPVTGCCVFRPCSA